MRCKGLRGSEIPQKSGRASPIRTRPIFTVNWWLGQHLGFDLDVALRPRTAGEDVTFIDLVIENAAIVVHLDFAR